MPTVWRPLRGDGSRAQQMASPSRSYTWNHTKSFGCLETTSEIFIISSRRRKAELGGTCWLEVYILERSPICMPINPAIVTPRSFLEAWPVWPWEIVKPWSWHRVAICRWPYNMASFRPARSLPCRNLFHVMTLWSGYRRFCCHFKSAPSARELHWIAK